MAISLYAASVPTYLQALGGLANVLAKGRAHGEAAGIDLAELVETRFHETMHPLRYQVVAAIHHSVGAVAALKNGTFNPPGDKTPYDYSALQAKVAESVAALEGESVATIDARSGQTVIFEVQSARRADYTAEAFLLSFSLPHFFFHVTTAYDILRSTGVPLIKRDYIGTPRLTV